MEELLDRIYMINRIKILNLRARVGIDVLTQHCRSRRFTSEQSHKLSGGCEAWGRTRGNWWPDVAAVYFINGGELVSASDQRCIELTVAEPCRRVATN